MKETQRRYPIVGGVFRKALRSFELPGGYYIPKVRLLVTRQLRDRSKMNWEMQCTVQQSSWRRLSRYSYAALQVAGSCITWRCVYLCQETEPLVYRSGCSRKSITGSAEDGHAGSLCVRSMSLAICQQLTGFSVSVRAS